MAQLPTILPDLQPAVLIKLAESIVYVGWNLPALIISILGAVVLLLVVNLFTRNR